MKKKLLIVSALAISLLVLLSISPDAPAQDPTPPATDAEPLETFEPTEKLSADSAVSFPVDI